MLGLLLRAPQRRATSSGSVSLNSPLAPSHAIHDTLELSDRSSRRNCHSWICPLPAKKMISSVQNHWNEPLLYSDISRQRYQDWYKYNWWNNPKHQTWCIPRIQISECPKTNWQTLQNYRQSSRQDFTKSNLKLMFRRMWWESGEFSNLEVS